jgi:hypothetical protein
MWRCIGVPDAIATTVGGRVEVFFWRTLFIVIALAASAGLFAPQLLTRCGGHRLSYGRHP